MEIIIILVIAIITFFCRVINLTGVPIFTDEAIYIRWAQIGLADPAHRFISLTDGKQPLLTWLMYPLLKIFSDPLIAGRFISVLSSVIAVIGIYLVGKELFDRKTAIFSSIIYIISPFTVVYDRLALMDSLLATFGIWSIYFSILLIRKIKLDNSLLLGLMVGLGTLTKSSAFFFLYNFPLSLLLFKFRNKKVYRNLMKWLFLGGISFIIALIIYNSLRLSPWFYIIKLKNYSFILTFSEFFVHPFALFIDNLHGLIPILISYLTIPLFISLLIGVLIGIKKRDRRIIYLSLWFLFPFLSLASFGKVIFPRFILFMVYPLFIINGYILSLIYDYSVKKKSLLILLPILLFYALYQSVVLIFNPVEANIPKSDRNQLFDDWPSGYGVKKVVNYMEQESQKGKVFLATEGTFGLNPAVYEIYLGNNKNVEIKGFWPVSEVPVELINKAQTIPTYFVFKEKQDIPSYWPLTLINKIKRGKGNTYLLFYRVDFIKK